MTEGLLDTRAYLGMVAVGAIMAAAAVYLYSLCAPHRGETPDEHLGHMTHARTMVFCVLALSPLFHTLNCRSRTCSAFGGLFSNGFLWIANLISAGAHLLTMTTFLRPVFQTTPLTAAEWGLVLGLSALPIRAFEVWKLLIRSFGGAKVTAVADAS